MENWDDYLRRCPPLSSPPVAHTYLQTWNTATEPVQVECSDDRTYVIKGAQAGRSLIADQVVGRLGRAMEAPVAEVGLVYVPELLVKMQPDMFHFSHGLAHACLWLPGCSDTGLVYVCPENRFRYALLAVLYGWVEASDHQFLLADNPPRLVYSVDHGEFFPNGAKWSVQDLLTDRNVEPDERLRLACGLTKDELKQAGNRLSALDEQQIAQAVAASPEEWGIALDSRRALMDYLVRRRSAMLAWIRAYSAQEAR